MIRPWFKKNNIIKHFGIKVRPRNLRKQSVNNDAKCYSKIDLQLHFLHCDLFLSSVIICCQKLLILMAGKCI